MCFTAQRNTTLCKNVNLFLIFTDNVQTVILLVVFLPKVWLNLLGRSNSGHMPQLWSNSPLQTVQSDHGSPSSGDIIVGQGHTQPQSSGMLMATSAPFRRLPGINYNNSLKRDITRVLLSLNNIIRLYVSVTTLHIPSCYS